MKQHKLARTDAALTSAAVGRFDAFRPLGAARAPHVAIWADGRVAWTLHILRREPPFDGDKDPHQQLPAKIKRLGLGTMLRAGRAIGASLRNAERLQAALPLVLLELWRATHRRA